MGVFETIGAFIMTAFYAVFDVLWGISSRFLSQAEVLLGFPC